MKTLSTVPRKIREGEIEIDGRTVMAFLADFREDGGRYVAEDIIEAAGGGDKSRHNPRAFINDNRTYLDHLARVTKCKVDDLIEMESDGKYWCTHQVAVRLAAWVSPRLAVAFDRALIEFAKACMARAFEWVDKRAETKPVAKHFSTMVDEDIKNPPGKEKGFKFGVMHNAAQGPFNRAMGGPKQTKAFKEVNKVTSAKDAYDTPYLVGIMLAMSVTIANIKKNQISDLWEAKAETEDNSTRILATINQLLGKSSDRRLT